MLVSTTYPFRDFREAGRISLRPEGKDQVLSFERPIPARYLKLVFASNGGGGYLQAGEVKAIGRLVPGAAAAPAYRELHSGAAIERYSSQYNDTDWAAANLLLPDGDGGQWAGTNNESQEVVVALERPSPVTDISIDNYAREGEANWARRVDVEISAESPYRGFEPVGSLTLPAVGDLHTLSLGAPRTARFVKLLFRSNGGGGYMEAARVRIWSAGAAGPSNPPGEGGTILRQLEETGRAVTQEIRFATNSAEILPESSAVLEEIAGLLRGQPELELIIEGHTDNVGGADNNLALSRRRADAVKLWLVDRAGIAELRLTTAGYGLTRPIADNTSEEGRAKNRRVELARRR